MRRWLVSLALALLSACPVYAAPPDAAASATVLHLTQSAERQIARDQLHVDLRAEKRDADPKTVQGAINRRMAKALARARQVRGIGIETGGYAVHREGSPPNPGVWSGSQTLSLSGTDAEALLDLAGALQSEGLVMSNLEYEISPKAVRAAEEALTESALSALARRAAAIAQQLHLSVLRYRDVTVGNAESGGGPMPRFAAALAAPMPAPVAAPGEATLRVTVTADIVLAAKQP